MAKVQSHGVASHLLDFPQFQPGIAYKSVAYKKSVYDSGEHNSVHLLVPGNN